MIPMIGQYHASAAGAWAFGVLNGKALFFIRDGASVAGTKIINDGQWHHIAVSIRSGIVYLYVDGALEAQATWGVTPSYNGNIQVGYNAAVESVANYRLNVSRVRVTQGQGRYTSNFTPDENTIRLNSLAA